MQDLRRSPSPESRGFLVLIGGAEDKDHDRIVLRRTVELNGAQTISVIPTASQIPKKLGAHYVEAFGALGVEDVEVLDVRIRADLLRGQHRERIEASDLVFFTGGDQTRLARVFRDTPLLDAIRKAWERGATIAGTSAGATAAGDPMIFDGQRKGLVKGKVHGAPGFGFLPGVTVDTHFFERRRVARLSHFLAAGNNTRGIGLSEDTALIVGPDGIGEVAGRGPVVVLSTGTESWSDYQDVGQGERVSLTGIALGFLSAGRRFDLMQWSVVDTAPVDGEVGCTTSQ
jgi:cyanophycinase